MALNKYCDIKSIAHDLGVIRPGGDIAIYISDELKTQPKRLVALHDELLKASGPPSRTSQSSNLTITANSAPQI
jgi:hypothetical protein